MKSVNAASGIRWRTRRALALSILVLAAPHTWAHGLRLAFLEGVEQAPGVWQLAVRVPVLGERAWPLTIELPAGCVEETPPTIRTLASGDQAVYRSMRCDPGRHEVKVAGIQAGVVDLLVRLESREGDHSVRVVTSADPRFVLEARGDVSLLARIGLGLEHILTGYDHLAFVAGLVLLLERLRRTLIAVTAFTLAHSVTLSLAALGVIGLPSPPVEAVIALSIVYLAAEIVQARRHPERELPAARIWAAALGFGLLHGFGFAGALHEAGLPENERVLTLMLFNLGIEIGQVAFVLVWAALLAFVGRLVRSAASGIDAPIPRLHTALAYVLGSVASFWTIERLVQFV
ncbi:MAG TPA: HupE/UreJ family protein [Pseudomonadales bacterium]